MSTLTVTNIKATGETASRGVSGVAAAWVTIPLGQASITDSVNVASLTDVGTGSGAISYSSSMSNATYAYSFGTEDGATGTSMLNVDITNGTKATTGYSFESIHVYSTINRTNRDVNNAHVVFGDLA